MDFFWVLDANIHHLHLGFLPLFKPGTYKAKQGCLDGMLSKSGRGLLL